MYKPDVQTIKMWYDMGLWNEAQVREAHAKGFITPEQFKEITGKGLLGE